MISDYYNRQFKNQRKNTKSIKLKYHQVTIQPFMIPEEHFHPNKKVYEELKYRCEKIKTEFSFITNEIQRELKQKKQKQEESHKLGKALFEKENRQKIQRQMTLTCKKLLRLHQFRKSNFEGLRPKKFAKNKQNMQFFFPNQRINEIVGHPVTYSPKRGTERIMFRSVIKTPQSNLRHSMDD